MTQLIYILVPVLLISTCSCEDYSDRARNFSIEVVYFTKLETGRQFVISPFAVWTIMTATTFAATGASYDQLRNALILSKHLDRQTTAYKYLKESVLNSSTPEVSLISKNFMFLDKGFDIKQDFLNLMKTDFSVVVKTLDFSDPNVATKIANGQIRNPGAKAANVLTANNFVKSRMILTNVISFQGLWCFPFNLTETAVGSFYDENNEVVGQVPMMHNRANFPFVSLERLKASVLEMPYGINRKYSMLIILPHPGVKVSEVYLNFAKMDPKDIFQLQNNVESDSEVIEVKIPKFQIASNIVLNRPLNSMGILDIFDTSYASFDRVANESLFVSQILHKAVIEVSEIGSSAFKRAAASTPKIFSSSNSTKRFIANKPFIFFVIEKSTSTLIFGGILSKPFDS